MKTPRTISELHDGLKNKEYSLVELLDGYFARIKAVNELNAFITVSSEYAYKKAQDWERVVKDNPKAFEEFPLLGVPIAMKDMYLTKGIRTTAGSRVLEDYVPVYSSTVFEKLEKAGAILVGKTNCDAWAHGASGENSDFGPTLNPWDKTRVPGGSSSGSAVSVATNTSFFAMGTDTGGSIRQPAGFCNVVGLKPTYGAVSRYGVVAMASSLDSMGHFAHTVEDTEKVFNITMGEDGKDATVKNSNLKVISSKLKIGLPKEYFTEGLDLEVKEKVMQAAKAFEKMGHSVSEVSLPYTKYAISVYYIVMPAEVGSNLGRYDGIRYGNDRSTFGAEARRRIMLGTYTLSSGYYDAYYLKAMKVRTLICKDFDTAFKKVDALITPSSPTPPFKIGEKVNNPLEMYLSDIYTVSANLAGICGLTLPSGFTKTGLPVGTQLLGPRFGENILFKLGKDFQNQTDYHTKLPPI